MTKTCGDDLIAARRFANLCRERLSDLFTAGEVSLDDIFSGLADIQSQAKLMHARFIYKAAQTVIDELTSGQSLSACVASVRALQKLISQYETGLTEIEPKTTSVLAEQNQPQGPMIVSEIARQKTAARLLSPLVKFADEDDQKNLVRLLDHAANDSSKKTKVERQDFDVIMPAVTNDWLRLARAQEKSISVSVSSAGVKFERAQLKAVRKIVEAVGKAMIIQSVETPAGRSARGLSQSAHLAVTLRENGPTVNILLSCEGQAITPAVIEVIQSKLQMIGGHMTVSKQNGVVRAELYKVPVATSGAAFPVLEEAAI